MILLVMVETMSVSGLLTTCGLSDQKKSQLADNLVCSGHDGSSIDTSST